MSAAVIRRSWLSLIIVQTTLAGLLVAWKFYNVALAGALFDCAISLFWLVAAMACSSTPIIKVSVPTNGQRVVRATFRATIIAALVWFGNPGSGVIYMLGILCATIYEQKFDADGVPLAKVGAV